MDWFRSLPAYRRKIYLLLIVAILLTLPCYCIGLVLLILAPDEVAPPAPGASDAAPALWVTGPGSQVASALPAAVPLRLVPAAALATRYHLAVDGSLRAAR